MALPPRSEPEPLIPKHGGYRKLKSFQVSQLVYDITVRFVELYINRFSRTCDQMVQAARSGVQNIAEGSVASGTSKKTELKLTNVARASLEELRLDYEDFLRQRGLPLWEPDHPALQRFKAKRCSSLEELREWVEEEKTHGHSRIGTDNQGLSPTDTDRHETTCSDLSVGGRVSPCSSPLPSSVLPLPASAYVANAALSLLNLACHLLDKQIAAQAATFEKEGGFTERLYRVRTAKRSKSRST
ncbi:MAG: four helix bundle suffix domain-containing protein [Desulfuromonadales bacterium]